jgi:hypothetical protein
LDVEENVKRSAKRAEWGATALSASAEDLRATHVQDLAALFDEHVEELALLAARLGDDGRR